MPLSADQLLRAVAAEPGQLPPDVASEVVASFERAIRGQLSVEEALGVDAGSRRAARNRAQRRLAALITPNGSHADRANSVFDAQRKYETTRWRRRDQHCSSSPYDDPSLPEYWLFLIFKVGKGQGNSGRVPGSTKQLIRILAEE